MDQLKICETISRKDILENCITEQDELQYVQTRLRRVGFNLDNPIDYRQDFETMHHFFTQEQKGSVKDT